MERWGVRERVCPVELFIRAGSITETQCGFRRERNQQEAPSPNAIRRWVRQWREEGSVTCKKPPGRPSPFRTRDNIARVLASISRSPRRSARTSGTLWLQQDGAMAHTAVISIAAFCRLFPQRAISRFGDVSWPPGLPDLTAPDFFLWGYLKSKVYSTGPTDLHALKENIREEIAKHSEETLQAVMRSFLTRAHMCTEEGGGHLKDIVHIK